MAPEDTNEVVAGVVSYRDSYLMGRRRKDSCYEFIGGKVKEGESYAEAFVREFKEETREDEEDTGIEFGEDAVEKTADSYPSKDNPDFDIIPVLAHATDRKYEEIEKLDSRELPDHDDLQWVGLEEFEEMDEKGEIKGQRKCLERLEIL